MIRYLVVEGPQCACGQPATHAVQRLEDGRVLVPSACATCAAMRVAELTRDGVV